jgi:hypothetical protein
MIDALGPSTIKKLLKKGIVQIIEQSIQTITPISFVQSTDVSLGLDESTRRIHWARVGRHASWGDALVAKWRMQRECIQAQGEVLHTVMNPESEAGPYRSPIIRSALVFCSGYPTPSGRWIVSHVSSCLKTTNHRISFLESMIMHP